MAIFLGIASKWNRVGTKACLMLQCATKAHGVTQRPNVCHSVFKIFISRQLYGLGMNTKIFRAWEPIMYKKLVTVHGNQLCTEKISSFSVSHPRAMMYAISLGVTLGVTLVLSFVMNPHDAFALDRVKPVEGWKRGK